MSTPKIWFITGASAGFGFSMTKLVLNNGDIAVATLRNPQALDGLTTKYSKDRLLVLRLDVSKPQEIIDAFKRVEETYGRIDVVFNNAGYGALAEIEGTPDDVARSMFECNFWGAANVSREAVRFFRDVNKPQGGRLLTVSSMAGIDSNPGIGYYSASKHALEAISEGLAKELDPKWNIKVTIIEPGGFNTRGVKESLVHTPVHPAYTDASLPTQVIRNYFAQANLLGDTDKATKLIYFKLATEPNPPLRLPVGRDAIAMIKSKLALVLADTERNESWSEGLLLSDS